MAAHQVLQGADGARPGVLRRLLSPVVQLREGEATTAVLLFAYSFLAMTGYNIVKPITRSKFISDLGADNLPWVQLVAGILIGVIMQLYSRVIAQVPKRWAIPATQAGCIVLLLVFWTLFTAGYQWASVGFYVLGLILGILLISQFWTLANDVYDPRQAKRLFGFIGGGASLGGATGAAITALIVTEVGTNNLLLVSAAILAICAALVIWIVRREHAAATASGAAAPVEEGVGGAEAITLLRQSRHLQIIAIVIGCAAMGGAIIEQQLNMAAQASLGQGQTDGITQFLAQVTVYLSLIGFVIQVAVTSRVHRLLGLGFALMILPVSLGTTAGIMLVTSSLWAPGLARVLDTSLRYTVDKTTREILFLPLPAAIKYRAKPFVDVTMDRFAKALGALTILVLIKPWGLALTWQQLSYASLALMAVWIVMALRAKREYLAVFRRSIDRQEVEPERVGATVADLQSIETLVEELASPDEARVLYAIDLLESLEKKHLVTPLLLHHQSPGVRERTLHALQAQDRERAGRWLPAIERLLGDEDARVRVEAVRTIAAIRGQDARDLMRGHLADADPRLVVTAAAALGAGADAADKDAAEAALQRLLATTGGNAAAARVDVARALGDMPDARFRDLLVLLLLDADVDVARAAIASVGKLGIDNTPDGFIFVTPLVSLLGNRLLKEDARTVLAGFGEAALEPLAYFLKDADENIWVRRNVPSTLARIPNQRSVDTLIEALPSHDTLIRDNVIAALVTLRRTAPALTFPRETIEKALLEESRRHGDALTLRANLVEGGSSGDTLLARALADKQTLAVARIFRLLSLIYPLNDINAVRFAMERGGSRDRASASEYLDNVVTKALRARVMLLVEDMPAEERVRRARVAFRTRRRDIDDTLAQLIHDDDQVLAAAAIHMAAERGVGAMASDIEFVLEHRDVRDWYVFEAASWAMAGTRMADAERRRQWLEPLPAAEAADRLRRVPLFEHLSVDDLFLVAATGRQMRHEPGRTLSVAGRVPDALHLLIDGEVTGAATGMAQAPAALAADELLAGKPVAADIRASDRAITLSLTLDEVLTLLSNNIALAQGLFRMLLNSAGMADAASRVLRGPMRTDLERLAVNGLSPVDRALILRGCPLFARGTGEQLLALAGIAREASLTSGTALPDDDTPAMYVVMTGALVLETDGAPPVSVGPGDTIGTYRTLTGSRLDERITVSAAGSALRLDQTALFELLADHVDLLQLMMGAVPRQLQPVPA